MATPETPSSSEAATRPTVPPADPVSADTADLIETLIRSALEQPDDWDALRVQLRSLVPDFHVPPPPPAVDDAEPRTSGEQRKLRLA